MHIDIAIGPCWPAAVPSIAPGSEGATKELVDGRAVVINNSIFDGKVPDPFQAPRDGVTIKSLFAVQAWRMNNASSSTAKTVSLDQETLVDFTANVTNGSLRWISPN